jgi:membrane associated rhomboid family serine protease
MNEAGPNPVEEILRLCAAAAPAPWYPKVYAKQADVEPAALAQLLEEMWLDGLIEKAGGNAETGPGISLTHLGQRVLLEPDMLERLRAGQPIGPNDRGAIVRRVFRAPLRPYVTRLIVLLNVVVFAVGYSFARRIGAAEDYLRGNPLTLQVAHLLDGLGALSPAGLIEGQWWRLVTMGFVHGGFLHLLLNMVFLYLAGRYIEQMWGHFRYLVIYLAGLLGGSSLAIANSPGLSVGASGAVCGLLGAEAVWFLFNGKYLPRALLRQARFSLISSAILLVFISSFKDVSGWGHGGGAAAGALAALLLHLQRFGPPVWRWLALLGFVPLAWYGHYAIERSRATNPIWHAAEKEQFRERFRKPILDALEKAAEVYDDWVTPVLEKHPTRRDPAEVEKLQEKVTVQQRELNSLVGQLDRAGPYYNPDVELAWGTGRECIHAYTELFAQVERMLSLGEKRTDQDKRALQSQAKEVLRLSDRCEQLLPK